VPITKSQGITPTERLLADFCERSFLRLWSYPNPYRDDGDELCDLLVVFEDQVFIFMDRESRRLDNEDADPLLSWSRWKRKVIDAQVRSTRGAERYVRSGRDVFLDESMKVRFPLDFDREAVTIHKIVVAHGAKEACERFSDANVYGSLGITYGERDSSPDSPFIVYLDKNDPVHILDSHNLPILFGELDTIYDFSAYLSAKLEAIATFDSLAYCGEEDLLAHYFLNFDEEQKKHVIGPRDKSYNLVAIGEGEWHDFVELEPYKNRKNADKQSYFWDQLIQRTCQNALDGTLLGNATLLQGKSAIHEMAKEPRFSRRALSETMLDAVAKFPDSENESIRVLNFMPSFFDDKGYVFLQLRTDYASDYDEYRSIRSKMLEIACGAAKNKFPHLNDVIGIAIEPPKFSSTVSEDFCLLRCSEWPDELRREFEEANSHLGFFASPSLREYTKSVSQFPDNSETK
jgi:hypothetical protein